MKDGDGAMRKRRLDRGWLKAERSEPPLSFSVALRDSSDGAAVFSIGVSEFPRSVEKSIV